MKVLNFSDVHACSIPMILIVVALSIIYYFFNDVDLQVDLSKESLLQQFKIVKRETNTSHVMQYGELVCGFDITCIAFLFVCLGCNPFSQNF